jgi:hypothetical protein
VFRVDGNYPVRHRRCSGSATASHVCWVVHRVRKTASYFIQSATTGFTANISPYRNRVSLKEAFEGLEPDDGKLSRTVLRGLGPSNGARLLGDVRFVPGTQVTVKPAPSALPWLDTGNYRLFVLSD